ncbi:MAG TPA: Sua5/YciO/YrdC/YwlC family protein [Rhodanobacteraceae bacterium]|nr:Sua5/YciO/YrdC/YwlC family protein [Rhodanobacteraceae bacterium]
MTDLAAAVRALRRGGLIAYPTEAVYGLGCDPQDRAACERLFRLKQRSPAQGVLLIAADLDQVRPYADFAVLPATARLRVEASWPGPATWVLPRGAAAPDWITGAHPGIALRVTAHPVAAALCSAFGGALVSTSANRHGEPAIREAQELRQRFGGSLDAIVEGPLGNFARPTPIRDAMSGRILRA